MEEDRDSSGSDWDEPDDNNGVSTATLCLFCSILFPTPEETFNHCTKEHGFDIMVVGKKASMDAISYIKMINYIRKHGMKKDVNTFLQESPWGSDDYMKPVLPEDPLLMFDIEDYLLTLDGSPVNIPEKIVTLTKKQYDCLTNKLNSTQRQLQEAMEDINKMRETAKSVLFNNTHQNCNKAAKICNMTHPHGDDDDESYFSTYSHYGIHHEMLQDSVRTEAYRDAVVRNPELFSGKVVLDVGCGTGILSMFAATTGAKHVLAVDQSDVIYQAMDIVRENNLHDTITLLKGRLEEVNLPIKEVDIIISEWMGYFLLFEGMLDTVVMARDKFLKPGGLMFPDRCTISLVALSDPEMHQKYLGFWDNVYGYRMSCFKNEVVREANIDLVENSRLCSHPVVIKEIDMMTCKAKDRDFGCRFVMQFLSECSVTAIVGYFDSFFDRGLKHKVQLSTSPGTPATHWKQTVFLLPKPLKVTEGQILDCHIECHRDWRDLRSLEIALYIGSLCQVYSLN